MSTCETCRWWSTEKNGFNGGDFSIFRKCSNPKCNLEFHVDHPFPDGAGPLAADDFGIGFWTGPEFGCIHHEVK